MGGDLQLSLSSAEKEQLAKLLAALEPFRGLRKTMPLQYVVAFLLVALEEGGGTTEYARRAGVAQSVMSRHLLDIGDHKRDMSAGFGLVTQRQAPLNLRKHETTLTPKGMDVAHQVLHALGKTVDSQSESRAEEKKSRSGTI
jgi:DNA-binding MarR family transcriptional regulator